VPAGVEDGAPEGEIADSRCADAALFPQLAQGGRREIVHLVGLDPSAHPRPAPRLDALRGRAFQQEIPPAMPQYNDSEKDRRVRFPGV